MKNKREKNKGEMPQKLFNSILYILKTKIITQLKQAFQVDIPKVGAWLRVFAACEAATC